MHITTYVNIELLLCTKYISKWKPEGNSIVTAYAYNCDFRGDKITGGS